MSLRIGFVGLGHMGMPIAVRMGRGGHDVVGFDPSTAAADRFVSEGFRVAGSPAAVAADADVVITMVPDRPEVLDAAISGEQAITRAIRPGTIYIDMSTVDPATSRELASHFERKDVRVADAPVARSVQDAWNGTSAVMVGCDDALFTTVEPLLGAFADRIIHCGPNGTGAAMKLVNNFINQGTIALIAEALTGGVAQGLSLELMLDVLGSTNAANANLTRAMPAKAFAGDFSAGFMVKLADKDQRLALAMLREKGIEPRIGLATKSMLELGLAEGHGSDDLSALFKVVERQAGKLVSYRSR